MSATSDRGVEGRLDTGAAIPVWYRETAELLLSIDFDRFLAGAFMTGVSVLSIVSAALAVEAEMSIFLGWLGSDLGLSVLRPDIIVGTVAEGRGGSMTGPTDVLSRMDAYCVILEACTGKVLVASTPDGTVFLLGFGAPVPYELVPANMLGGIDGPAEESTLAGDATEAYEVPIRLLLADVADGVFTVDSEDIIRVTISASDILLDPSKAATPAPKETVEGFGSAVRDRPAHTVLDPVTPVMESGAASDAVESVLLVEVHMLAEG